MLEISGVDKKLLALQVGLCSSLWEFSWTVSVDIQRSVNIEVYCLTRWGVFHTLFTVCVAFSCRAYTAPLTMVLVIRCQESGTGFVTRCFRSSPCSLQHVIQHNTTQHNTIRHGCGLFSFTFHPHKVSSRLIFLINSLAVELVVSKPASLTRT